MNTLPIETYRICKDVPEDKILTKRSEMFCRLKKEENLYPLMKNWLLFKQKALLIF